MTRYESLKEIWMEETAGEEKFDKWLHEYETWVKNRNSEFHSNELIHQLNASIK